MTNPTRRAPWLQKLAALFLGLTLCLVSAPLDAQAPPDLGPVTTTSGLSVHQDFYAGLNDAMLLDNDGRTAVHVNAGFLQHTDQIESEFESIEALATAGFDAALAWLASFLPAIWATVVGILAALIALLICGDFQPTLELTIPSASVYAAYTVDDMQLTQTSGGQRFDVTLTDVGLISEVQIEVGIGSCTDGRDDTLMFVYPSVTYRVDVQYQPGGGTLVSATLVGPLPALEKTYDGNMDLTADTLWSFANPAIGGTTLEQKLAAFATNDVPDRLEEIYASWFVPYLAQGGWLMNLSGAKQTLRYAENAVLGTVGPALYGPLQSDVAAAKTRVTFGNLHSQVTAHPMAVCADATPFDAGPAVTPDFAAEGASAQGTLHVSYKSFQHRILAGIRSAVGLRDELKPGSPYVVEHALMDLVPEALNTIHWLFRSASSPIVPIPITPAQMSALLATPADQGQTLAGVGLGELELRIRVCEVARPTVAFPLGLPVGDGVVEHRVVLAATIERNGFVVLSETFDATFVGGLRLSKVPGQDALEFRTIRAELLALVNGAGVDLLQLSTATPFASAPVSVFLRAFLGDNSVPTPTLDTRVFYLVEGLTGPLVERAAHGMVVLPGLDFPAFDGAQFGFVQAAVQYHGNQLGLDFDHPALCASIERWGQTLALVGGAPSATDFMLAIEVFWAPSTPQPGFKTKTGVTANAIPAPAIPLVQDNPSRHDGGHLATTYYPVNGDETRVMNASGDRIGDFLPGGGQHFVAATAVAYRYLREAYPSWQYPDVTVELRPYRRVFGVPQCDALFPGPLHAPGHPGAHHEGSGYPHVYEALTFETRKECLGVGACDGARVVAMWTAPLFHDCPGPDGPLGVDFHTFDTVPGTLRVPPSTYAYFLETCAATGGGIGVGEPVVID